MAKKGKTGTLAKLDDDGILVGYEVVSEAKYQACRAQMDKHPKAPRRVHVPDNCDLTPGDYIWRRGATAESWTFMPRPKKGTPERDMNADTVASLSRGLLAVRNADIVDLPKDVLDWLKWFEKSVDNRGRPAIPDLRPKA